MSRGFAAFLITIGILLLASAIAALVVFLVLNNNNTAAPTPQKTGFISYPRLGTNGRLGNQMFQMAATVGFGRHLNKFVEFKPDSVNKSLFSPQHADVFKLNEPLSASALTYSEEACFFFTANKPHELLALKKNSNVAIDGYRQNPKYFVNVMPEIRRIFRPNRHVKARVLSQMSQKTRWIGVHVRRGDYVDHPVHQVCHLEYYLQGIEHFRQKYDATATVMIITDDKKWCEEAFQSVQNVMISPFDTEQDDFVCLSMCDYKVISNSTFGWWAAYMDARYKSQVMAPRPWINDQEVDYESLFDKRWIVCDIDKSKKCTITDPNTNNLLQPVGAYYQCYKQPRAFLEACTLYREVYDDTSFVIVNDAGDDFKQAAAYFKATSYAVNDKRTGNGYTTKLDDFDKIKAFILNFLNAAKKMKPDNKFYTLLEDDVAILRAIRIPTTCSYDLIGNNANIATFNEKTLKFLKTLKIADPVKTYYGGCGGSLFRTWFWANLDPTTVLKQIQDFGAMNNNEFHSDMVLGYLCVVNQGNMCCGQDVFPTEFAEKRPALGADSYPAVLHMFKDLYNAPVTSEEFEIIEGSA